MSRSEFDEIVAQAALPPPSVSDAEARFRNSTTHPATVADDTAALKRHFDRLKYVYLQQETRDWFLRHITQDPAPVDMAGAEARAAAASAELAGVDADTRAAAERHHRAAAALAAATDEWHRHLADTAAVLDQHRALDDEMARLTASLPPGHAQVLALVPQTAGAGAGDVVDVAQRELELRTAGLKQVIDELSNTQVAVDQLHDELARLELAIDAEQRAVEGLRRQLADPGAEVAQNNARARWYRDAAAVVEEVARVRVRTSEVPREGAGPAVRLTVEVPGRAAPLAVRFDPEHKRVEAVEPALGVAVPVAVGSQWALVEFVAQVVSQWREGGGGEDEGLLRDS